MHILLKHAGKSCLKNDQDPHHHLLGHIKKQNKLQRAEITHNV
jgi:hypothetical protein